MMGRKAFVSPAALLITAGLLLTAACQAPVTQEKTKALWKPAKAVVLPFQPVTPKSGEGDIVRSPLTSSVFSARDGVVANAGLAELDQALADGLQGKTVFQIVPASQAGLVFGRLQREDLGKPLRDLIMETGRRFQADAVLVGHLYRFSQRVGGSMAAQRPASVAFDLALVRSSDGVVVWKNSFDETQRSLSENLFEIEQFVEHGLRWFTAEELASYGMSQMLRRFPWRKASIGTGE
jgi:hypothetical protein